MNELMKFRILVRDFARYYSLKKLIRKVHKKSKQITQPIFKKEHHRRLGTLERNKIVKN